MIAKIDAEFNHPIGFTADTRGSISAADHEQRKATLNHFASAVHDLVELIGIEPTTPCLQSRCSPN